MRIHILDVIFTHYLPATVPSRAIYPHMTLTSHLWETSEDSVSDNISRVYWSLICFFPSLVRVIGRRWRWRVGALELLDQSLRWLDY